MDQKGEGEMTYFEVVLLAVTLDCPPQIRHLSHQRGFGMGKDGSKGEKSSFSNFMEQLSRTVLTESLSCHSLPN